MSSRSGNISRICLAAVTALSLIACKSSEQLDAALSVKMDPALTKSDRKFVVEDFKRMLSIRVQTHADSIFAAVFGGPNTPAVVRYLDDRINYILPKEVEIEDRLVLESARLGIHASSDQQDDVYTVATNLGLALWLIQETARPKKLRFIVGDQAIPLTSSRVGIIRLGAGYTHRQLLGLMNPQISRISTLVHEARHSDCTGGLSLKDLERLKEDKLPLNKACGHLHEICPEDHPYAGHAACDSHPWGAYAAGAVYAAAVAKNCQNCDKQEVNLARVVTLDSLSRILVLDDMLAGKFGLPDMSSSGLQGQPLQTPAIERSKIIRSLDKFRRERSNQPSRIRMQVQ